MGGTMNIADTDLAGDTLEIVSAESFAPGSISTSLSLSHRAQVSIDQPGISGVYSATTVSVSGQDMLSVDSAFPLAFNSSQSYVVNLAPDAKLTASFDLNYSTFTVSGARGTELINDGSEILAGSQMTINTDVLGVGSFQVSALGAPLVSDTGYLEFGDAVSRGETVTIGNPTIAEDGIDWDGLKIDQPREFQGSVVLQPNAFVELAGLAKADSYSYSNDILSIWSGDHATDTLRLTNQSGGDLAVATDASGDVFVEPSGPSPLSENLILTSLPLHQTPYTFTTLTATGATETFANTIDNRGEVAGSYIDSNGEHGFVYDDGTFTTLNVPGATVTSALAINDRGEVVGDYSDGSVGHATGGGFIYDDGTYTTLNVPGATSTNAGAINDHGEVVGNYLSAGEELGFIYDNGTFTALNGPGAVDTDASAINDRGEVVGSYGSSSTGEVGYIYDNGTYTTLTAPGATSTDAGAINDRGEVVGEYVNSSGDTLGFLYDNGTYTTLNVPGATSTQAFAINDRGEVVGNYVDSSDVSHGFVYDNGTYTTLTAPGATFSAAVAINDRGEVAGTYTDNSGEHGLLASPGGGEASAGDFGELLSAHARLGGMRDFLPDVPGIDGRSPHFAHPSGMMDQTFAAGARFTPFGGLAGDHTAEQALLHVNNASLGTS
jgi:probable HAF family extracellular repeat protein